MINLLPHTQKKDLERAYTLRVITLFLLAASAIIFCGLVLLFPIYVSSNAKKISVENQVSALHSQKNATKEELNKIISNINSKLSVFSDPQNRFNFSKDVVVPVMIKQNEGISITTISYSTESVSSKTDNTITPEKNIIISGIAKDRPSLLLFENNLKQNNTFSGVNVPISNFVSGSNINFNIQFKLNPHE